MADDFMASFFFTSITVSHHLFSITPHIFAGTRVSFMVFVIMASIISISSGIFCTFTIHSSTLIVVLIFGFFCTANIVQRTDAEESCVYISNSDSAFRLVALFQIVHEVSAS
jgi:hypothetical protein